MFIILFPKSLTNNILLWIQSTLIYSYPQSLPITDMILYSPYYINIKYEPSLDDLLQQIVNKSIQQSKILDSFCQIRFFTFSLLSQKTFFFRFIKIVLIFDFFLHLIRNWKILYQTWLIAQVVKMQEFYIDIFADEYRKIRYSSFIIILWN